MIAVAAATPFETAWISAQLTRACSIAMGKWPALKGRISGVPALVFNIGVGKTNAAHGITLLLEKFSPDLLLLIGCGGAYRRSGLAPGNLAIANEEIFGDDGVITPQGWRSMRYLQLPLLRKGSQNFYNRFPADLSIVRKAKAILKDFNPRVGPFVTVSEVTGTDEKADEMERRFRGICENMEGAAVAELCILYNTPFLEIRGISNVVKQRNTKEWDVSAAARISQEAARDIIIHWDAPS
jgi:futalosine hydrolase